MNLRQPLLGQYAIVVLLEQRSRRVGATCTALETHGRPRHMTAPEYRKIGAGLMQRRRLFCQNRVSSPAATDRSGVRKHIDGIGCPRARLCIDTRDPREEARVPRAG